MEPSNPEYFASSHDANESQHQEISADQDFTRIKASSRSPKGIGSSIGCNQL